MYFRFVFVSLLVSSCFLLAGCPPSAIVPEGDTTSSEHLVVFVDAGNTGTQDGQSWASAFTGIQSGINAAYNATGEYTVREVWVAKGTYTGGIVLKPGVDVFGNWNGTEENYDDWLPPYYSAAPGENDPPYLQAQELATQSNPPTIIDASQGGYHGVSRTDSLPGDSAISGFTIKDGIADGGTDEERVGAGIYIKNVDANVDIGYCAIRSHGSEHKGAGVYVEDAHVEMRYCSIRDCYPIFEDYYYGGGGIYAVGTDASEPTFFLMGTCYVADNSNDEHETGVSGGGVAVRQYIQASVSNSFFEQNIVLDNEAGVGFAGGGALASWPAVNINSSDNFYSLITNCGFFYNTAVDIGGAIFANGWTTIDICDFVGNSAGLYGGAVYCHSDEAIITGSTFEDNISGQKGGAISTGDCSAISGCTFIHNQAGDVNNVLPNSDGGAIYIEDNVGKIENCIFSRNQAITNGGAINISSDSSDLPVPIVNCSFSGNVADSDSSNGGAGNALYVATATSLVHIFFNSIAWGSGQIAWSSPTNVSVTALYSNVSNSAIAGTGCIDIDPLYEDPANDDLQLKYDPLYPSDPTVTSACIDAGYAQVTVGNTDIIAPTIDILAATARPQGAGYDMGAYER